MKKSLNSFASIIIFLILFQANSFPQNKSLINPDLLTRAWPASWIAPPNSYLREYGVFHFRKNFELSEKPDQFIVHVSADNRYRLFINGNPVCSGPARGDLGHWRFETIDISPWLLKGKNVIAAVVWNFGEDMPMAQVS